MCRLSCTPLDASCLPGLLNSHQQAATQQLPARLEGKGFAAGDQGLRQPAVAGPGCTQ